MIKKNKFAVGGEVIFMCKSLKGNVWILREETKLDGIVQFIKYYFMSEIRLSDKLSEILPEEWEM